MDKNVNMFSDVEAQHNWFRMKEKFLWYKWKQFF